MYIYIYIYRERERCVLCVCMLLLVLSRNPILNQCIPAWRTCRRARCRPPGDLTTTSPAIHSKTLSLRTTLNSNKHHGFSSLWQDILEVQEEAAGAERIVQRRVAPPELQGGGLLVADKWGRH